VRDAAALREGWKPIERRFAPRALLAGEGDAWQGALQLVSRAGVASDAEVLEFRSQVETLAAGLGAQVAAPEMRAALDAARELDKLCVDADIQVALHVVGLSSEPPLEFAQAPFTAARRESGVTLTLDLARTHEPGHAYEAMVRAARRLAESGGRLVDDNGSALDERALAAIAAQVDAMRRLLAGRGIEPGGALALRLFS
jgi:ZipA-like protein with FtsZ-binding domain